ncbi:MAG: hypothetical protein Q8K70_09380 [Bacteroidota bacterium]|nr:hypothetical protein [Bacteroidota bacterium]
MKNFKTLFYLFLTLISGVVFVVYIWPYLKNKWQDGDEKQGVEVLIENYGESINEAAETFDLPANYLKALCMMECGGAKKIKPRFEKHVFKRLKQVRDGKLNNYEHVTKDMVEDASDEALKNLASSWGPFQLMGYKCLLLDIKIKDIRGDDGVYYGVKWIDLTYGKYLRQKRFKDAFHIHNAGKPFPKSGISKTHHPQYVNKGIKYMAVFDKMAKKN